MDIELNETEIKEGLADYVEKQGLSLKGKDIDINIVAGRSNNGFRASLSISPSNSPKVEKETIQENNTEELEVEKEEKIKEESTPPPTKLVFGK